MEKRCKFGRAKTALIERFRKGQKPFSGKSPFSSLSAGLVFVSFLSCPQHFRCVRASSPLFSGLFLASPCACARFGHLKATDLRQRSRFRAMWVSVNDESLVQVTFRTILWLSLGVALALNLLRFRVSFFLRTKRVECNWAALARGRTTPKAIIWMGEVVQCLGPWRFGRSQDAWAPFWAEYEPSAFKFMVKGWLANTPLAQVSHDMFDFTRWWNWSYPDWGKNQRKKKEGEEKKKKKKRKEKEKQEKKQRKTTTKKRKTKKKRFQRRTPRDGSKNWFLKKKGVGKSSRNWGPKKIRFWAPDKKEKKKGKRKRKKGKKKRQRKRGWKRQIFFGKEKRREKRRGRKKEKRPQRRWCTTRDGPQKWFFYAKCLENSLQNWGPKKSQFGLPTERIRKRKKKRMDKKKEEKKRKNGVRKRKRSFKGVPFPRRAENLNFSEQNVMSNRNEIEAPKKIKCLAPDKKKKKKKEKKWIKKEEKWNNKEPEKKQKTWEKKEKRKRGPKGVPIDFWSEMSREIVTKLRPKKSVFWASDKKRKTKENIR